MGKKIAFVFGAALGAGVALLLAPRPGAETRAKVIEAANGFIYGTGEGAEGEEGAAVSAK